MLYSGAARLRRGWKIGTAAVWVEEEANRLIRELLDLKRVATREEIQKVLAQVRQAPFRSGAIRVDVDVQGARVLGRTLGKREPSSIAHLAKRVLVEKQWADDTTPEQYLADLHGIADDPAVCIVIFRSRDGQHMLGLWAPNHIPAERLGEGSQRYLWVLYSADYGTITTGYQVSSLDRVAIPEGARWL